jgi:uncharacterized protein YbjT (DUF2867 family)
VERRRIGLLGATGYTGQRVLRELPVVGRNRSRCWPWPIASKRDLPVAEMDVTSTADLTRLLEPSKSWTLTRKCDN